MKKSKNLSNEEYWEERESERIKLRKRNDKEVLQLIKRNYESAISDTEKSIADFYSRYASKEGITIADARKRVDSYKAKELDMKIKEYMQSNPNQDEANEMLKLYNLTLKVNRFELLSSELGLRLVQLTVDNELLMYDSMIKSHKEEIESLKEIFKVNAIGYNAEYAKDLVKSSYHNATWSERLWVNQKALKTELDTLLRRSIIAGRNPREFSKDLMGAFGRNRYEADRILITETARVQGETMASQYRKMGFEKVVWITEAKPCSICSALSGKIMTIDEILQMFPRHPFCRCSYAPHYTP